MFNPLVFYYTVCHIRPPSVQYGILPAPVLYNTPSQPIKTHHLMAGAIRSPFVLYVDVEWRHIWKWGMSNETR